MYPKSWALFIFINFILYITLNLSDFWLETFISSVLKIELKRLIVFAQVSDIVNGEDIKLGEGTNWVWTVEKALSYFGGQAFMHW